METNAQDQTVDNTKTLDIAPEKRVTAREARIVVDSGPLANLFDTARFEHMGRIASMMAGASLIPEHMWKDKAGPLPPEMIRANCFLIVNQAVRWGMDPFAVVPETYVVSGKLGFQGKLIAAVINSRGRLKAPLNFKFSGTKGKDDYTITVFATLEEETTPREITLSVGEGKTDNKMWTKDPEQKLVYTGCTKWARRHRPEVILGVLTEDDLEQIQQQQGLEAAKPVFSIREKKPTALPASTAPVAEPASKIEGGAHEVTKAPDPVPTSTTPGQASAPEEKADKPADDINQDPRTKLIDTIRSAQMEHGFADGELYVAMRTAKIIGRTHPELDEMAEPTLNGIVAQLPQLLKLIEGAKEKK